MKQKKRRSRTAKDKRPGIATLAPRHRRLVILASIFLVSFVPGAMWLYAKQPAAATDYKYYLDLAVALVDHHQFGYPDATATRLPGFPFFLAALIWIGRSYMWLGLWNVGLTALIGVLVYYVTLTLTRDNERTAMAAGFLAALNPTFIFFSPILASEHLSTPLLLASLLFLGAKRPRPLVRTLAAGVFLGLAMLTRGEGAFYLPIAVLFVVIVTTGVRQKALLSACLLIACFAVIAPWQLRNAAVLGSRVGLSTTGGLNFYYAHNDHEYGYHSLEGTPLEGLDDLARQREGYRMGLSYLRENPARLVSDIGVGTKRLFVDSGEYAPRAALYVPEYFSPEGVAFRRQYPWGVRGLVNTFYVGLLVLGAASFAYRRRYPRRVWLVPLGIVAMTWLCYAVVFWAKARYRFTMEALLCVLAGVTLSEVLRHPWWRRRGLVGSSAKERPTKQSKKHTSPKR